MREELLCNTFKYFSQMSFRFAAGAPFLLLAHNHLM